MRTPHAPVPADAVATGGVLLLVALELVALAAAPARQRPLVTGELIGASAAAFITVSAVLHARRRSGRRSRHGLQGVRVDASWFTEGTLDAFPMDQIRPYLLGPEPLALERLYTAWILAVAGHDAGWLADHLELPQDVTSLLVTAARMQHP